MKKQKFKIDSGMVFLTNILAFPELEKKVGKLSVKVSRQSYKCVKSQSTKILNVDKQYNKELLKIYRR